MILVSAILLSNITTNEAMANLTSIWPFFIVDTLKTSVSFYVDKLGFEVWHTGPDEDPFYAIVGREHVAIMLKAIAPGVKSVPNHTLHNWARWDAYISVTDPEILFEEYRSAGVPFGQPLQNDGDGLRGFEVIDADGYILFFGRPVS
jgi:catechol 2,3-dioxygenase-like lactoylglutathione lyase family enzyme